MAADLTLLALPATPENWRCARIATYQELLPRDEVAARDGEEVGYLASDARRAWSHNLHKRVDWFEVGPISWIKADTLADQAWLPAPTAAVAKYWAIPVLATKASIAETMVLLNLPDRSHYRSWHRDRPRGYKVGRRYARGVRGDRRVARRQHVKRWLVAHQGWIVWAESW